MKRLFFYLAYGCGMILVFILVINAGIYLKTRPYIYNSVSDAPNAEVVLIPGAAIFPDGTLSSIFIDRVDTAIRAYEAGKVSKILVSGDNSTVSHKYRKSMNYRSAYEVAMECGIIKKVPRLSKQKAVAFR